MEVNDITPGEKYDIAMQESMSEPKPMEVVQEPAILQKRSRKRSITIFVVVSILNLALLALLWMALLTPSAQKQQSDSESASTTSGNYNSPMVGKHAPDFTLATLNGHSSKSSLSDFKGKPVVLNFWAAWCTPCNDEAPFLQKIAYPQLQSRGVAFIGIDTYEGSGATSAFMQKYGISYPNVQDTINGATAIDYGVTTFPVTVFINRNGVITSMWNAPLTDQGLKLELAKIS